MSSIQHIDVCADLLVLDSAMNQFEYDNLQYQILEEHRTRIEKEDFSLETVVNIKSCVDPAIV